MIEQISNHREFTRCQIAVRVEVRLESGVMMDGTAINLSLKGILFATERSLPLDSRVKVSIVLDAGQGEQRIDCLGHVARIDNCGVAIEFSDVDGDSLEHLRQLLRFNADDADSIDLEIHSHVGIKNAIVHE